MTEATVGSGCLANSIHLRPLIFLRINFVGFINPLSLTNDLVTRDRLNLSDTSKLINFLKSNFLDEEVEASLEEIQCALVA